VKALLLLVAAALSAAPAPSYNAMIHGVWHNPDNTVSVRIDNCGDGLCGTVIQASPSAIADARDAGYPGLIGMQLMSGYRADGPGHWSGTVFVPDLGRSFSSHIKLLDPNRARIAGCLFRSVFCMSQTWQRQ
jgi:uncharacterized protein (DUF2147 family)